MPKEKLSLIQAGDKIRKAYKSGKRVIEIDGLFYDMVKQVRKISYSTGGIQGRPIVIHKATETWINCQRVDGQMAPMFSVEFTAGGNRRTSVG